MRFNTKENERSIGFEEWPTTRPRIVCEQAPGTKYYMVGLNHIMLDFMRHFSECSRNFVFAPGYNSSELTAQVNQRTKFFDGKIIVEHTSRDGSGWDSRIDHEFKRLNGVVMRELLPVILKEFPLD